MIYIKTSVVANFIYARAGFPLGFRRVVMEVYVANA